MKTRILHTKIYSDEYYLSLDPKERCVFLTLLTNDKIGLSDIYELPDSLLSFYTGISIKDLQSIKDKLEKEGKFQFYRSYVKIVNSHKYQDFRGGKNDIARARELNLIPSHIKVYFEKYPIDTPSIDYSSPDDSLNNHKSKTINQKPETGVVKGEKKVNVAEFLKNPPSEAVDKFVDKFIATKEQVTKKSEDLYWWWRSLSASRKRKYSDPEAILRNALSKDYGERPKKKTEKSMADLVDEAQKAYSKGEIPI